MLFVCEDYLSPCFGKGTTHLDQTECPQSGMVRFLGTLQTPFGDGYHGFNKKKVSLMRYFQLMTLT